MFKSLAFGASKVLNWHALIRYSDNLGIALNEGTWINISDYISKDFPDIVSQIEIDAGYFVIDQIEIDAFDIEYWTNVFSASEKYIEMKIVCSLLSASDEPVLFSGIIGRSEVKFDERSNSVSFPVHSYESEGDNIRGEYFSTQYVEVDTVDDGSDVEGLILFSLPGVYIRDTAIASYVMRPSIHLLTYEYNGGSRRMRLNSGRWISISSGVNTLGDANDAADDEQRVEIYIRAALDLPTGEDPIQEEFIVITPGEKLPNQWFTNLSIRHLFDRMFSLFGINEVVYDDLEIDTYDNRKAVSFLDMPPADPDVNGNRWAITGDGTNLWISIGNKLYTRDADAVYTLKAAIASVRRIVRLIFNGRNNHIWIIARSSTGPEVYAYRFIISTETLSDPIQLTGNPWHYNLVLFDYEYDTGSWKYALLYVNGPDGEIKEIAGDTLSHDVIFTRAGMGYSIGEGPVTGIMFQQMDYTYFITRTGFDTWALHRVQVNSSGVWVDDGIHLANIPNIDGLAPYTMAAFHSGESRVYFFEGGISNRRIRSHTLSSNTPTNVQDATDVYNIYFSPEAGEVYFTDIRLSDNATLLYAAKNNEAELLDDRVHCVHHSLHFQSNILYGIDRSTRLFKYDNRLAMYVPKAVFPMKSIREAFYELLRGFNLMSTLSSGKRAYVYRRSDDSGQIISSGNTLDLDADHIGTLRREDFPQQRYDIVKVNNVITEISYNGEVFHPTPIELIGASILILVNPLIPDEIIRDVAFYLFQYWNRKRFKVYLETAVVPVFWVEPFDVINFDFQDRKLSIQGTGVIVSNSIDRNGSVAFELLVDEIPE